MKKQEIKKVMTKMEMTEAIRKFATEVINMKGSERAEGHTVIEKLLYAYGVDPLNTDCVKFEKQVTNIEGKPRYLDVYIVPTQTIIEMKSRGVDLDKPQSGHDNRTPFSQAKEYNESLPFDERAKYIVLCNFEKIRVYDMNDPKQLNGREYTEIRMEELHNNWDMLKCIMYKEVKEMTHEIKIDIQAGEKMQKISKIVEERFLSSQGVEKMKDLKKEARHDYNIFNMMLMICMFAEDYGVFKADAFKRYINELKGIRPGLRFANLQNLFKVIGTPINKRNPVDKETFEEFDYISLPIFKEKFKIESVNLNDEFIEAVNEACDFDWSAVSPIVVGSIFEHVIDVEKRKENGMHYTLTKYIHWIIKPAFLNNLNEEFEEIRKIEDPNELIKSLEDFQDKIADLDILDPTCGSGNFLIESYKQLGLLEIEVVNVLKSYGVEAEYKVSISKFHGIEFEELASIMAVACGWIAECQLNQRRGKIYHASNEYLHIINHSALTLNWNSVISNTKCDYIIGNYPFGGSSKITKEQKAEALNVFGKKWKEAGNIDYAGAFEKKAFDYIKGTDITVSVIMTSSVHQGTHPGILWKPLIEQGCSINWGYTPFKWEGDAQVMCTITSISANNNFTNKIIYDFDTHGEPIGRKVKHINPYMVDGSIIGDFVLEAYDGLRGMDKPLKTGKNPSDGGYYTFTQKGKEEMIKKHPELAPYFKRYYNGKMLLNDKDVKFYLLLNDCPRSILRKCCKDLLDKVENHRKRLTVSKKLKENGEYTPYVEFTSHPLLLPEVSTSTRRYIPMKFEDENIYCTHKVKYIDNAEKYDFALLESNVHTAYIDAVCGRLEDRWSYSALVYNNFPVPKLTNEQKELLNASAQKILDVRAKYANDSLADLYDVHTMPAELLKAHYDNDKLVMKIYGFDLKITKSQCAEKLLEMVKADADAKAKTTK